LFIFDRLGAGNVYNPEQRFVPYLWLYATRPDGQRLRAGDAHMHSRPLGEPWGEGIGTLLTASYYRDGVLLNQFLKQGGNRDNETIFEFLWRDTTLQSKPIESLPLTRYFESPFGWMITRTRWGEDAVIAEMKINTNQRERSHHLNLKTDDQWDDLQVQMAAASLALGMKNTWFAEAYFNLTRQMIEHMMIATFGRKTWTGT